MLFFTVVGMVAEWNGLVFFLLNRSLRRGGFLGFFFLFYFHVWWFICFVFFCLVVKSM